jgi:hypothetical protein
VIDREFEETMDEHQDRKHREALSREQEAARATYYALTLKAEGKSPSEVRELVQRRYPRVKRLLDGAGQVQK